MALGQRLKPHLRRLTALFLTLYRSIIRSGRTAARRIARGLDGLPLRSTASLRQDAVKHRRGPSDLVSCWTVGSIVCSDGPVCGWAISVSGWIRHLALPLHPLVLDRPDPFASGYRTAVWRMLSRT